MPESRESTLPSITVVIEWENIALSSDRRTEVMLGRLNSQLADHADDFRSQPEVLILYEPDEVNSEQIDRLTTRTLSDAGRSYTLEIIESDDLSYYEAKNRGAQHASGEVVVFLDSDVIPEDDWLSELVAPFADDDVQVTAGHTYMEPNGLVESAFALFWFFPTRDDRPISGFFANNVAFRRSLFTDYEFPDLPTYRGQCYELSQTLEADGVEIVQCPEAITSHPPPNGLAHFVIRALGQGHDQDRRFRLAAEPVFHDRVKRTVDQLAENLGTMGRRAVDRSDEIRHGQLLLGPALLIGTLYYLVVFLGQTVSSVSPSVLRSSIEL